MCIWVEPYSSILPISMVQANIFKKHIRTTDTVPPAFIGSISMVDTSSSWSSLQFVVSEMSMLYYKVCAVTEYSQNYVDRKLTNLEIKADDGMCSLLWLQRNALTLLLACPSR